MSSITLNKAVSHEVKLSIVHQFWRKAKHEISLSAYEPYFEHYHRTCAGLFLGLHSEAMLCTLTTHGDLLGTVGAIWDLVKTRQPCDRATIRSRLVQNSGAEMQARSLNNSINLALRLWLHLNIQEQEFSPATKPIQWNDNS